MDEQTSQTSSRPGVPDLDIFKIAGQSISGFLPSWKTGDRFMVRQPYMSLLEAHLALHLEYHPHVRFYQRGDVSEAFARAHRLMIPLGAPYRIGYIYDGKAHDYLPDFVGTLVDGTLLLVTLYECKHRWPCYGKPAVIFHDRGKIFTSERATQVLV